MFQRFFKRAVLRNFRNNRNQIGFDCSVRGHPKKDCGSDMQDNPKKERDFIFQSKLFHSVLVRH